MRRQEDSSSTRVVTSCYRKVCEEYERRNKKCGVKHKGKILKRGLKILERGVKFNYSRICSNGIKFWSSFVLLERDCCHCLSTSTFECDLQACTVDHWTEVNCQLYKVCSYTLQTGEAAFISQLPYYSQGRRRVPSALSPPSIGNRNCYTWGKTTLVDSIAISIWRRRRFVAP